MPARALIGSLGAILALAALPATSASAAKSKHCPGRELKRHGRCLSGHKVVPPAAEARSATLVVTIMTRIGGVVVEGEAEKAIAEMSEVLVRKLGSGDKVLSSEFSKEHTVHVTPGHYEVAAADEASAGRLFVHEALGEEAEVTVAEGQTLDVTVYIGAA